MGFSTRLSAGLVLGAALSAFGAAPARAADTIKVMLNDPLSGPQSNTMERAQKILEYMIKRDNDAGGFAGKKVELVPCDNKFNPKDGKNCLDRAIDQGIHYVIQGIGSNVTTTLMDAIEKHNARNPGKEVVLIDWAAQPEEFTNEACSFWHFRTDAHIGMKMKAMIGWLAADKSVKRVYLINMDYSLGQSADAAARRYLKQMRPDIEIVGSELHPANRVQDFTPYVAKILATHPDVVITANIGNDLSRLIRAGNDTGLNVRWLTAYASLYGQVTQIGEKGVNRVFQVSDSIMTMNDPEIDKLVDDAKAKGFGDYENLRMFRSWMFLSDAMRKAGADHPVDVATAMETASASIGKYHAAMRASDHQVQLPLYVSVLSTDAKYKQEGTPWGFKIVSALSAEQVSEPTTCKMKRPKQP